VLGGATLALWRGREAAIEEWKQRAAGFTTILAEHAGQTIRGADLVLRSLQREVDEERLDTAEHLRARMGTQEFWDRMRSALGGAPQIDVATVIAPNGDVVNFTRSWPAPPINLADRDYFQAAIQPGFEGVTISAPVANRGTGSKVFYLARQLRNAAGTPIGVVITGIRSDFFMAFYQAVNPGRDHTISLFRGDGILLARDPLEGDHLGRSFAGQPAFRDVQMPELDGIEATRRIRALPAPLGRVPVMALTADAMTGAEAHYRKAGFDNYLAKLAELLEPALTPPAGSSGPPA